MILVDTSVWIPFFNGTPSEDVEKLAGLIEDEEDICISDYILTEILQGFGIDREFETAREFLLKFPVYSLGGPPSHVKAAQIYRKCRKRGITVRKTIDCMIAQTALENDLALLHNDGDFDRIASVVKLKVYGK